MDKKYFQWVSWLVVVSLVALLVVQVVSLTRTYKGMQNQYALKVQRAMERTAYYELVSRKKADPLAGKNIVSSSGIRLKDIPAQEIAAISIDKSAANPTMTITTRDSLTIKPIAPSNVHVFRMQFDSDRANFALPRYDSLLQENLAAAGITEPYRLTLIDKSGQDPKEATQTPQKVVTQPSQNEATQTPQKAATQPSQKVVTLRPHIKGNYVVTIQLDSKAQVLCSVAMANPGRSFLAEMRWIIGSSVMILCLLAFSFWYLLRTIFRQKTLETLRNDFTHNITHELKTPIAVAYAANDAMLHFEADRDPAKRLQYLTVVNQQLSLLSDKVQRILSLSTLEETDFVLAPKACRLDQMLESVIQELSLVYTNAPAPPSHQPAPPSHQPVIPTHQPVIPTHQSVIPTHQPVIPTHQSVIPTHQPAPPTGAATSHSDPSPLTIQLTPPDLTVMVDAPFFTSVLSNLLDNALKYAGKEAKIIVSASHHPSGTVQIQISDNGIGISTLDCARIFDKFYRVPTGNRHDVKGSGLGLYYARLIVEKHGGTLTVESTLGRGTTFLINLPA